MPIYGNRVRGTDVLGMALFEALAKMGRSAGMGVGQGFNQAETDSIVERLTRSKFSPVGGKTVNPNGTLNPLQDTNNPFATENVGDLGRLQEINPETFKALMMSEQMKQPSYFNLGEGDARFKQPAGGGPPILWATGMQKSGSMKKGWRAKKDANGNFVYETVRGTNDVRVIEEEYDEDTQAPTGAQRLAAGGSPPTSREGRKPTETELRKEFMGLPNVKGAPEMVRQLENIASAEAELDKTKNFAGLDQTIGVTFQKMLDPTSVVRESEFARSAQASPVINRIKGKIDQVAAGGIGWTNEERRALIKEAKRLKNQAQSLYNMSRRDYTELSRTYGLNPSNVVLSNPYELMGGEPQESKPSSGRFTIEKVED